MVCLVHNAANFSPTYRGTVIGIVDSMYGASAAIFSLFKTKTIASNATTELITQPIVLQESEILKAQATTAGRLHVVVSLLEINRD